MVSKEENITIRAFIGLGNDSEEYKDTYHNVGDLFSEYFQEKLNLEMPENTIKFFKLSGYMNNIGKPVSEFLKKNGLIINQCLIIHDDSDLSIGEYKLSLGSGSAGHKGVISIINFSATNEFLRLRVGIRPTSEENRKKAGDLVLARINSENQEILKSVAAKAWKEVKLKIQRV